MLSVDLSTLPKTGMLNDVNYFTYVRKNKADLLISKKFFFLLVDVRNAITSAIKHRHVIKSH